MKRLLISTLFFFTTCTAVVHASPQLPDQMFLGNMDKLVEAIKSISINSNISVNFSTQPQGDSLGSHLASQTIVVPAPYGVDTSTLGANSIYVRFSSITTQNYTLVFASPPVQGQHLFVAQMNGSFAVIAGGGDNAGSGSGSGTNASLQNPATGFFDVGGNGIGVSSRVQTTELVVSSITPMDGIAVVVNSSITLLGGGVLVATATGRGGVLLDGATTHNLLVKTRATIAGTLFSQNGNMQIGAGGTISPSFLVGGTLQGLYTTNINLDVGWFNVTGQSMRWIQSGGVHVGANGGNGWGAASLFVSSQTSNRPLVIVASDTKKFQVDGSTTLVGNSLQVILTTGTNVNKPLGSDFSFKVSSTPDFTSVSVSTNGYLNAVSSTAIHALSSCGVSPTIYGGGTAFTITPGATASGCTITFTVPFVKPPVVSIGQRTMSVVNALSYTVTNEQLVISQTGIGVVDVILIGGTNQ